MPTPNFPISVADISVTQARISEMTVGSDTSLLCYPHSQLITFDQFPQSHPNPFLPSHPEPIRALFYMLLASIRALFYMLLASLLVILFQFHLSDLSTRFPSTIITAGCTMLGARSPDPSMPPEPLPFGSRRLTGVMTVQTTQSPELAHEVLRSTG